MSLQAMDWALRTVQGITPTQKLILICLANHAGPEGTCWPSQNIISDYSGLSRETISRNLSDLEKRGFINSVQRRDESGRDLSKIYILNITKEEGLRTEPSSGETENHRGVTQDHTGGGKLRGGCDVGSHPVKSRFSEHRGVTENHRGCDAGSQGGVTQDHTSKENLSYRTKRSKTPPTPKTRTSTDPASGNTKEGREKNSSSGVRDNPKEAEKTAKGDGSPSRQNTSSDEIILPDWLDPKDWNDFLSFRREIKAPMNAVAQRRAIIQLEQLRNEGQDPSQVINQSIVNGWRGLFSVKDRFHRRDSPPKTFEQIKAERTHAAAKRVLDEIYGPQETEDSNGTIPI
ncbi:MAG: helix-turn-helix domain-containing protein [Leptospirales bacterium]